ncbi:Tat pathway signal protein [Bacillus sp. FJAT-18019]|nr:Tat pathway signal protein [Bacillus sp. FJAT-18019]
MSNERYDDWFDEAFEEAFDRAASRSSLPTNNESKRQSWQQVKLQIERSNKKKQRLRRFHLSGVIAASMMLGAFVFSQPSITQAVSPIYQQIVDWGDGITGQIFGKKEPVDTSKALTAPPPDLAPSSGQESTDQVPEAVIVESNDVPFTDTDESLTESQKRVLFKIPEIGYTPEGFEFHEATGIAESEQAPLLDLHLQYKNADEKFFYIDLIDTSADRAISMGGEVIETLTLQSGAKAYLTETNLRFMHDNDSILVNISGFFSKDEFVKIANSIH